jgi:2-dehydropantoate 2-reductase
VEILVFGAGAVGGYYGARFWEMGHTVHFVARGKNFEVLRENGLTIHSISGDLHIYPLLLSEEVPEKKFDLIVIAVKAYDTDKAISSIAPSVGERTRILSLQNGLNNPEKIARVYGKSKTYGGIAFIGAERIKEGVIRHTAAGGITIGAMDESQHKEGEVLAEKLSGPNLSVHYSYDIRKDLWLKLLWNAPFNPLTFLAGSYAHTLLSFPEGEELVRKIMKEVVLVAREEGIDLPEEAVERYLEITKTMGPVRTSMLVDRLNRRPIEVEEIVGVVVRKGKEYGVPTPTLSLLYLLLQAYQKEVLKEKEEVS